MDRGMGSLWDCRPINDRQLHNQLELATVTDEQFRASFASPSFTLKQKLLMGLCFVIFFGWARLILLIVSTVVFAILVSLMFPVAGYKRMRDLGCIVASCYIRVLAFCMGVFWVRHKGSPARAARVWVHNHTSVFDGPLIWMRHHFTVVAHAGAATTPIFGKCLKAADTAFIERGLTAGASQVLTRVIGEAWRWPLGVAPEAKLSDGTMMYRFRTGAFLTTFPIQPIAIRYWRFLPAVGASMSWLDDEPWWWIVRCLCSPGFAAVITFLPPFVPEELVAMSPQERADATQLRIANSLGVLAISTSTKQFFAEELEKAKAAG